MGTFAPQRLRLDPKAEYSIAELCNASVIKIEPFPTPTRGLSVLKVILLPLFSSLALCLNYVSFEKYFRR